jgi:SP family arabinose:H+ symporter-like MFS transporter
VVEKIAGPAEAALEITAIRTSLAEESGSWRELFAPNVRRPLWIAMTLAALSQVTGINTVIYYGSILFRERAGSASASSAIGANVAIGLMNFTATIAAIGMIDRLGRRPLLLMGSGGMAAALALLGLAFRYSPPPGNFILVLILAYVACFAVSLGPVTWVYMAELFPTAVRGRAMSAATLCIWAACLLVTLTFLSLVQALGPSGAFWLYGSLSAATLLFVYRLVPETRRRTLEEIQHMWKK